MAIVTEELIIKVGADTGEADRKLGALEGKTKKAGSSFATMAVGIAAAGVVLGKLVKVAGKVLDLWAKQERAILKNEAALKAWGYDVESGSRRLQQYAGEMQNLTNIDDDAVLSLTSIAVAMGKTATEAEEATRYAIGLSEAFGIDMKAGLKAVALAQAGEFTQLQRYIPALRTATTETEKWDFINKATATGLDSLAASTDTLEGKTTKLKNTWGDFGEQIGRIFALNPPKIIDQLTNALEKATANWQATNDMQEWYNEQMAQGADLTGIQIEEVNSWNAANERGAGILAYLNRQLGDNLELTEEIADVWKSEKGRDYWLDTFEASKLQYGMLTDIESIEAMRAQAIKNTATEYEDINNWLETMINNYYDLEAAKIEATKAQEWQEALDRAEAKQLAFHEAELTRIEKEKQARINMIAAVTSAWGNSFNAVGSFIGQMFKIEADGLKEGSDAQKKALKKQAIAEKATAIFSSLINTAVGITKSMPNPFLIAATAILGAAQTAGIIATPIPHAVGSKPGGFTVPSGFEDDSYPVSARSGETVEVNTPLGQGSGQMAQINLILDGRKLGQAITDIFGNRYATVPTGVIVS